MKNKMLTIALLLSTGIALPANDELIEDQVTGTFTPIEKGQQPAVGTIRVQYLPLHGHSGITIRREYIGNGKWEFLPNETPTTGSPRRQISEDDELLDKVEQILKIVTELKREKDNLANRTSFNSDRS